MVWYDRVVGFDRCLRAKMQKGTGSSLVYKRRGCEIRLFRVARRDYRKSTKIVVKCLSDFCRWCISTVILYENVCIYISVMGRDFFYTKSLLGFSIARWFLFTSRGSIPHKILVKEHFFCWSKYCAKKLIQKLGPTSATLLYLVCLSVEKLSQWKIGLGN